MVFRPALDQTILCFVDYDFEEKYKVAAVFCNFPYLIWFFFIIEKRIHFKMLIPI